jgi:hypothetical protein
VGKKNEKNEKNKEKRKKKCGEWEKKTCDKKITVLSPRVLEYYLINN